jgi:hypothetical protein
MNFWLSLVEYLNKFLRLIGLRWQRPLGVIYDSVTKQPVDPVVVKLINAETAQVVASNIANMNGEYGFMADPGLYQIYVQRPNYKFPSQIVTSLRDGVYNPVYHGETFQVTGGVDVISMSIPLDPVAPDWNQQAKKVRVHTHPVLQSLLITIFTVLFWFVLLAAVVYYAANRSTVLLYVFGMYAFVLLLAVVVPRVRLWGRVLSKESGVPVAGAVVEVSYVNLPDVIIARAVSVSGGKFFIRLNPGEYRVTVKSVVDGVGKPKDPSQRIVGVGAERVLNKKLYV